MHASSVRTLCEADRRAPERPQPRCRAVERLVLKFTDEVNATVKASRETLEALKRHLSPGEIIELLIIIGHWRQTASILETTEVDLEEFAGKVDILANMPPRP